MKRSHLASIVDVLESHSAGAARPTAFLPVLRSLSETLPRRGLVIIVSDLLGDREGIAKGMQLLRRRGHDLVLLHVMDDDELDFPFRRAHPVRGPRGERLHRLQSRPSATATWRRSTTSWPRPASRRRRRAVRLSR